MSVTDHERPRYMISVAADLVGMHPQTLRIYEQKGLLRPKRCRQSHRTPRTHSSRPARPAERRRPPGT